jgi:DNA-binding CsgD family transcriptional regulator
MHDATDAGRDRRRSRLGVALFMIIACLVAADVVEDSSEGVEWPHLMLEVVTMTLAVGGAGMLWRQLGRARDKVAVLGRDLERARGEAERWQGRAREVLRGLGEAIDEQFQRWSLSAAERQVGLMLLKGLSLRDIAGLRKTSERTSRQQAFSLYHKAGLSGRAELSAFFLEELLLPLSEEKRVAG